MVPNALFLHEQVLKFMDYDCLTAEAVCFLKRLISVPSTSRNEAEVADVVCEFIRNKGYEPHRKGNNVWCICDGFDESKPNLLMNSHIDTVKPVDGWTYDPFVPMESDGRIYGLGSNDAGASVVSLFEAFTVLTERNQPYNLIFLASCEEEVSGRDGIESVLPLLPRITLGVVGEPTGMNPAIAEKGLMVLDVTSHGKAGHAARNEGENAIYKALDDICWFKDFKFPKVSPLLGPVKTTVTVINAGTQHNVIPDKCVFTVDVRTNECYTNHEIFDEIVRNVKSEVKARSFRLNSSSVSPDHPIVRKAVEMGLEPFGSPTLSDQALMNFPSVKIGPGSSSRSHTADEFICVDEIAGAINLYVRLLDGLDLQG